MKKFIYLTVCLAVLGISQAKAQAAKVALQHNGIITLYNADELQKALNASVDGDTIYLNEGTFTGGVTIAKKISLIGAGQNTTISGDVTISLEGTLKARLLDAISVTGSVKINGDVSCLNIRKCQLYNVSFNSGLIKQSTFDRCYITNNLSLSSIVKDLKIYNSLISYLGGSPSNVGDAVFANCNISYFREKTSATFVNCIMYDGYDNRFANSNLSYCLMNKSENAINEQNCYINSNLSINTVLTFKTNILGNDGTVVGASGGTTPYTLVPSVPTVTSYNLNVNTTTKRLNVNISVESK